MNLRPCLFIAAMFVAVISSPYQTNAQVPQTSSDPLRRGHALLIGNAHYRHGNWARLDDIPLQLETLHRGLKDHFETVQIAKDLETEQLRKTITNFLRTHGNDTNARLFIYYAGHGYTEVIRERNENRGYITGIDTPKIDGTPEAFKAARSRAIWMDSIGGFLKEALAKHILFVFDSCFAGTIFTNRAPYNPPRPLPTEAVERLLAKQARDFITAGSANEKVPAHSPLPELFLAALNGAADPYGQGVISTNDIHQYLRHRISRIQDFTLTPQVGSLPHPAFAEGEFLFRVIKPTPTPPPTPPTPAPATVSVQPMARASQLEPKRYKFTIWVSVPDSQIGQIREVSYLLNHETLRFQTISSTNPSNGFAVSYTGWGCLRDMRITMTKQNGSSQNLNFNMCPAIGWK